MAGGSQLIISDKGITLITPGKFEVHAGQHSFNGSQRVFIPTIKLPVLGDVNNYNLRYLLQDKDGQNFVNYNYVAFLPNGEVVEGCTDEHGYTDLFNTVQPEEISIHLYKDEQLDVD